MADSGAPDRTEDETGMPVAPEGLRFADGAAGVQDGPSGEQGASLGASGDDLDLLRTPTGDGCVQVAYCHETRVSHSWHQSLMSMVAYDKTLGLNALQSGPFMIYCGGPHGLVEGRNLAVRRFLDETEHEWLLWIDTDMGFEANSLDRMLQAADPIERPVVGALCFAMKHAGPDGKGGYHVRPLPTIFGLGRSAEGHIGFMSKMRYNPNTLMQVAGTGSAFIIIHRSVLLAMREQFGDEWYNPVAYGDGQPISEDLSFCWRVNAISRPIFVHTGIEITHHKEVWLGADQYEMPDEEPISRAVTKDPVPEGMAPEKWAMMNREERRAWKRASDR